MTSSTRRRTAAFIAAVMSIAGLVAFLTTREPAMAQAATPAVDLSRMVVVGDSILAGFASGGLVRRGRMGQRDDAPALVARQAGARLAQPLMKPPGFPPPLTIVDKNRNGVLDPGEVKRRNGGIGFRSQPSREAHNLAVPGERVTTVFDTVDVASVVGDAIDGNAKGRDVMKVTILGLPLRDDSVSQIRRVHDIEPTFLMVWLGNNDVLGMATQTNPGATQVSAADFGTQYRRFLNALADTGAPMAVANLPDVTGVPLLRRAAGDVTSCQAADGSVRPVAQNDLLSIQLSRSLLPQPPCGRVLDSAEQAFVRDQVNAFNVEISGAIADVSQNRGVPIAFVDAFALFDQFRQSGVDVRGDGSLVLSTRYLGGLFTLDGVHPTRTAHALIANAFIDAMNTQLGSAIARVDVAAVARRDPFVGSRFAPAGEPPFGLIAKDDDVLDEAFGVIEDGLGDLADDLKHRFKNLF
jgi:hypothetical protein